MCGIVGKVSLRDAVDPLLIERMCAVIEHRGPDSRGVFVDENIGLGAQRLAIIDLETGDQPIFNEDRSIVVVLNGEIYNYRELRAGLDAAGHRFTSESDTEVIVHLYEEEGEACVHALRGMFAFALWDARKRRLLLARDRLGKKPLYFSFDGAHMWFASEAKAILQDPAVPRDVDYAALDAYLQYQYVPHDYCAFAALAKLPPAHLLVFDGERIEQRRYWKLSYANQPSRPDEEACELLRSRLLEATRLRLRSDVPVGAFLSGGVDSSAVVAAMAHETSHVRTFTIGFEHSHFDERQQAREVAQLFGTDHEELVVEPDVLDVLPRLVWHYGEPFADQSALPTFYLSELTRRHVTVALNGDGGDETFGGYRRYVGNDLARRLEFLPHSAGRAIDRALTRLGTGDAEDSRRARLLRLARAVQLSRADRYAGWVSCFDQAARKLLYTAAFAERVRGNDPEAIVRAAYETSDALTLVERLLDVDTQTSLPDQLLVKVDIASMAHSLEVRSPLLDHLFVELAASLPASAKIGGMQGKRLLRSALAAWIPSRLLDRPKRGFTMPIAHWLRDELRELPRMILLDPSSTRRGLFDAQHVARLIADHQSGAGDNAVKLWALIQLELWFQTYVDRVPDGPITLGLGDRALTRPLGFPDAVGV
jgi:asparagine synthase (glutamine-hydrolysing)